MSGHDESTEQIELDCEHEVRGKKTKTVIEFAAGRLTLGLVPAIGGSVAYFRSGTIDLMRPLSAEARRRGDVFGVAMFPMVPYANRIADNAFSFGGRLRHVAANNPPERLNLHGTGWQSIWAVADQAPAKATLVLDRLAPEEAYSYTAVQNFVLTEDQLVVTITLTNRCSEAMPFGFGAHPWFVRDPDVTIAFRAEYFWMEGPEGIATDPIRTPPELDFSTARALPSTWRNNDYGGWSGTAEIRFPSRGLGLRIEAQPIFNHLMLYANPALPHFCLEPQTNVVCAFNKIGLGNDDRLGVIELPPGASTQGSINFTPFDL
jgi:aldose 1-epimerase